VSAAKFIKVPNRLGEMVLGGGGKTAIEAVRAADAILEELRPRMLIDLDARLEELEARFGPRASARADEPLQALYDCALAAVELSGALPNSGLDEAARAICELVSRSDGVADWEAIDVHLAAVKMLRAGGRSLAAPQRAAILQGLADVCQKVVDRRAVA
jgi:hypothetical protein